MEERQARKSDCIANQCDYRLPHYHCIIPNCGKRILLGDGDRRATFHPCCSLNHIIIYNVIFFCEFCGNKLLDPGTICVKCGKHNDGVENPKNKPKPVTNLSEYRDSHPSHVFNKIPRN